MNDHREDDLLCPGCTAEIVNLRALADDLAAVLAMTRVNVPPFKLNKIDAVLARWRAARQ